MLPILFLLALSGCSTQAAEYQLMFDNPEIFSPCLDGLPGSIDFTEAFDLDNMIFDEDEEGIHISGNLTTKWDLPGTERISARFRIMQFDRGSWQPTLLNQHLPDICSMMWDTKSTWYKHWFQNVVNREEIPKNCLSTKGTVWVYKPFIMSLRLGNVGNPNLRGRYKVVYSLEAFDENNERRPTSVCFEMRGVVEKMQY
ncbi:uncharacterized protein [Drosophila takahashii]|uniref:uncharacterized protein n=1 Tax=Drosophila takahashii TaxID=29030 RepID=UPI001CF869C2|nr:uncharacterized protein LOC108055384 [Drosophila takahashii]